MGIIGGRRADGWLAVGLYHFRDNNILITLMKLKFEMLLQLAPGFILGLHWKNLPSRAVFAGMIVGLLVAVGLYFGRLAEFNSYKLTGIHEGVWGLLANLVVIALVSWKLFRPGQFAK